MNTNLKSFPTVTPDFISWDKLDVDELTDTVLTISMDAAKEAVLELVQSCLLPESILVIPIYKWLNSDEFINDPDNQVKVINQVLNKHIGWK